MAILNQKKAILVNDETSMRNPDYSLVIYLIADKVAQYRLVAENRREKEEAKHQTAKKTFTQKFHLQQSDLKLLRNAKTPCMDYLHLPLKNPCSLTMLTCHRTPSSTTLKTLGVSSVTSQIREGKY